tara:strand:+ start:48 stop:251 length:204 start_codon:yes stop_codon:yes gene_type:complete
MDRIQIIRALCKKKYRKRPTAEQILAVIHEHSLNAYTSDGKIRQKNAMIEAMRKALNTLKPSDIHRK